jgi:hypothetical protein
MAENQSSNFWIGQFVLRLMELRPSLPMLDAVQYAVFQYPYAQSLEPEHAAAIFSLNHHALGPVQAARRRRMRDGTAAAPIEDALAGAPTRDEVRPPR